MSETRFTAGPWATFDHGVGELVVFASGGIEHAVCSLDDSDKNYSWKDGYSLGDEAKANAHLIAAAPDMYLELVEIKEQLQFENYRGDIRDRIDSVLAKARGEQA